MASAELKLNGDNCFKNLKFEEAIEHYKNALSQVGADSIVLNSNISACYFELGTFNFYF